VTGAELEDEVFIATGAAIFHGAHLGRGSEVRVHGTVHLRTRLEPGATVPIGWVAVGDPARIFARSGTAKSGPYRDRSIFPTGCMGLIATRLTLCNT
jgi:carbonic anhydrase/acetyltransferase-like protein (isoleucine patch superfamily)